MVSDTQIQKAIEDLNAIRRTIDNVDNRNVTNKQVQRSALKTGLNIQTWALASAGLLTFVELFAGNINTLNLLNSATYENMRIPGLLNCGFALVLIFAAIYFVIFRSAKDADRDFNDYLARNFQYLNNLNFGSDLFLKFVVFSILIFAEKPEWIAPMFLLFIADYLLQGRFFKLPLRAGLTLGVACLLGGLIQFAVGSPLLVYPGTAFCLAGLCSIGYLRHEIKSIEAKIQLENKEA